MHGCGEKQLHKKVTKVQQQMKTFLSQTRSVKPPGRMEA
jgi:hypothetical protein